MQTRISDLPSQMSVSEQASLSLGFSKTEETIHLEEKKSGDDRLTQGPRMKDLATYHLEKIIQRLLDPNASIQFGYNTFKELEIEFDGNLFNVT
ncbi:MAG: hypothetical protein ACYCQI_13785 [Gammaproteobacteria bacterium]